MQIDNVFLNVSKGQAANKDDLMKCFKTEDRNAIILEVHITLWALSPTVNDTINVIGGQILVLTPLFPLFHNHRS